MKSTTSSSPANSNLADEIKKAILPQSNSTEDESGSAQREASSPESEQWVLLGTANQSRLALLRSTVSSIEWQAKPHLLRLMTQQDGAVVVDLSEWDLASAEALWLGLVVGSRSVVEAPYELPELV